MSERLDNRVTDLLSYLRGEIVRQYDTHPTGCGGSFGELLCYEIHQGGLTFTQLAQKWGLSLSVLGELIWDHCKRLEDVPSVDHEYERRTHE